MGKGFKELSLAAVKARREIRYIGAMRRSAALLWFVMAFLTGAALFAATHPRPVLQALVRELKGAGLYERCRQAGACGQQVSPPALPATQPPSPPPDMDRA